MDGQLAALPRLEAALLSDRLSFSKVRLLARFVTPENEAHWIERARGVSVRTLEKQVRAVDRGALESVESVESVESGGLEVDEEGGDARPNAWVRMRVPLGLCFKWARTRAYAAKVAGKLGDLKTLKRKREHLIVGVCGCLAQQEQEALFEGAPHLDLVLGPRAIPQLPRHVEKIIDTRDRVSDTAPWTTTIGEGGEGAFNCACL